MLPLRVIITRPGDHWKLVTDSSLQGNNTFELVSPILVGENGLKELETVCWVLDICNAKVNDSCGFHVHMDAASFNLDTEESGFDLQASRTPD